MNPPAVVHQRGCHLVDSIPLTAVGKIYKPQLRCDAAARVVKRVVQDELALAGAQVQVSEGGRRGTRVRVTLPGAARSAVPDAQRALAAYLFDAEVAVSS